MERIVKTSLLLLLVAVYSQAAPNSCGISVKGRDWCGWLGISQTECQARGCCFDVNATVLTWCYHPIGSNPCTTDQPCRREETCVSGLSGTSYTCTCPSGRTPQGFCNKVTDSSCSLSSVLQRKPCGYKGITEAECTANGCCYDVNAETQFWCYRKTTDSNPCDDLPCRNTETCVRNGNQYACTCPSGRANVGIACNKAVGTCAVQPKNRKSCGWFGISEAQCADQGCCFEINSQTTNWCFKQDLDPCANSPCKNGGACSRNGDSFTCTCGSSWSGADCSTPNPCGSRPCKNGGACTNRGTSFSCACTAGWTGTDCSTVSDPCKPNPCLHGGTCIAAGASFRCNCVSGWTGSGCNTEVNVCLQRNPCLNGGTCVKYGDSYECKCTPNWAGTNCDMGSAACSAVAADRRINCGWGGVTLADCNQRSCCFSPMTSRPACFYAVVNCDTMDFKLRVNCGFPGISFAQCTGRGCCFDDDEETNPGPVCYRKANPACIGVSADHRIAQGTAGIQPNECNAKGWCWDSSAVPNCFTSTIV